MGQPAAVYASVDVETTGYSPRLHEIVEIAVIRFTLHDPLADRVVLDSIVRPKRRVPNWRIHGITNRMVRAAPSFEEIAGNVVDALVDCIVVCHNARFDLSFLEMAFRRLDAQWQMPYLCTLRLKDALGLSGAGGLADLCKLFSIEIPGRAHASLHDARATIAVLRALLAYAGHHPEASSLPDALERDTLESASDFTSELLRTGDFSHLHRSTNMLPRMEV